MNARTYVLVRRRLRWICVLLLVGIGVVAGANWTRHYCPGGSMITNPDGFASANVAAGLRAANH